MPHLVKRDVKIRQLRQGDLLIVDSVEDGQDCPEYTVVSVDAKVKWALVTVAERDRPFRLESEEEYPVRRMEQTDEEKAAERLQARIWGIERSIAQAPENLAAAREKMIAELDSTWTSHWAYQNFVAAKEEARLWAEVARTWELAQLPEHADRAIEAGEEPFVTIVDAKEYVVRKYRSQLIENFTPTSRSTSVVSNALEDVQREVQLKFVQSRWF